MVILFRFFVGKGGGGKQKFFNPKTQEFVGRLWETKDAPPPPQLAIAIHIYSYTV